MQIPAFVITGFLDSGKTTLLNKVMDRRAAEHFKMLLIQFEFGEEELQCCPNCSTLGFTKEDLDHKPKEIVKAIQTYLAQNSTDEIWIEWNGVTPFSVIQELFTASPLYRVCRIEKVIHIADAATIAGLLGKTGMALPEQISNCDFAVAHNIRSYGEYFRLKKLLHSLNAGIKVYKTSQMSEIFSAIYRKGVRPVNVFCVAVLWVTLLFIIVSQLIDLSQTPANTLINVFLGVILQALPFLLIGVLISSAIQIFLSSDFIERRFPRNLGLGMLAAVLFGFCLPVCDCASVPIFRSLIKKGVPVPVAVTFLTATPVINPVVMLSTYYAFNGSMRVVAVRVGLGIISSVLIGLIFSVVPSKEKILSNGFDGSMCSCGCYDGTISATGVREKLHFFIRHSQTEFFNVGKYLMIGAFISALFQTIGLRSFAVQSGTGFALSLLVMIILAFLLSMCSSSDAVVARSFSSNFSAGAAMGFLVFGPMMDIKNLIMLSGGFSRKFVGKLLLITFLVCYFVVLVFARPLLGV